MVLPITGPINTNKSTPFGSKLRSSYTQVKPFDRPLNYVMDEYWGQRATVQWDRSQHVTSSTVKDISFALTSEADYVKKRTTAFNQAYARLKDKSGPSSGWLENIATVNQSRRLLADACLRLGSVALSLRKGHFDEIAIALGLAATPKGVSRRKHISQNFLAFEYGVKPLISDIQETWKLLTSDPGRQLVRARAFSSFAYSSVEQVNTPTFQSFYSKNWSGTVSVQLQAWLRISNPDVFLANKLGLLDLALPWKLIPFSFIVDWFVNVEDVISSLTDWYGCVLEQPFTSELARGQQSIESRSNTWYPDGTTEGNRISTRNSQVKLIRSLGISGPALQVKPFRGFSLERGAQAISLVLSVFGK